MVMAVVLRVKWLERRYIRREEVGGSFDLFLVWVLEVTMKGGKSSQRLLKYLCLGEGRI